MTKKKEVIKAVKEWYYSRKPSTQFYIPFALGSGLFGGGEAWLGLIRKLFGMMV